MTVRVIELGDGSHPLNTLGAATRRKLHEELKDAERNPNVTSIVLIGQGQRHFSAGADLTEFHSTKNKSDDSIVNLVDLCDYLENCSVPIVAAIRGAALGGGCEVALSCHYRICSPCGKMGLPEVAVGVIPGAGGTQRLPRLVGVPASLEIILRAKPVQTSQALQMGLVHAVCNDDDDDDSALLETAIQWAEWATLLPIVQTSKLPLNETPERVNEICNFAKSKLPPVDKGGQGVHAALEAVRACALPFEDGMQKESELFFQTLQGNQGRARRHAFFAVRAAQKSTCGPVDKRHALLQNNPSQCEVGVVGAGTMGSGIALVLLQAGFRVWLVDVQPAALHKGLAYIYKTLDSLVDKKKLSSSRPFVQRLQGTTDIQSLANCRLVVEAVVENMDIKKAIFQQLNRVVLAKDALLLSNTSTLDVAQMARALSPQRRGYCAGWHFFSPALVMKLVEIVAVTEYTLPTTVALLQSLTKRIGKIGVTVGNCNGFVGNRMLDPYTCEMVMLLTEGHNNTVQAIDKAMVDFGMAIGPFSMSDLAGNDIGYFIRKEKGLVRDPKTGAVGPNRAPDMRYTELADDLVTELGRVGQKALKGWYDYDVKIGKGRKPIRSQQVEDFCKRYVVDEQPALSSDEIVQRLLFGLVNEGFKILEEGIAQRPSDIDVVYLYGYGWPAWRGGPMYWADHEVGLPRLLSRLEEFHARFPGSAYYAPSKLLQTCVARNMTVQDYYRKGLHKQNTASKL